MKKLFTFMNILCLFLFASCSDVLEKNKNIELLNQQVSQNKKDIIILQNELQKRYKSLDSTTKEIIDNMMNDVGEIDDKDER